MPPLTLISSIYCRETSPHQKVRCRVMLGSSSQEILLLSFVPQERKKEKDTNQKNHLKSMKRKDRMAIRASICLSYKQEIAKIITEYPNDKRGIKGTS